MYGSGKFLFNIYHVPAEWLHHFLLRSNIKGFVKSLLWGTGVAYIWAAEPVDKDESYETFGHLQVLPSLYPDYNEDGFIGD